MSQGPFRTLSPLTLASASPRRQALLAGQGLCFSVHPSHCKEPLPLPGEAPADYAARMANLKGQDVANTYPGAVIISADTIVVQGPNILGKPRNAEQALCMLQSLMNGWHEVVTGFCILHKERDQTICHTVTTRVHMPSTSDALLAAYIATDEPMDKAGAYGIQGIGAFLVDEVQGSYTNVVGLPLRSVLSVLLDIQAITIAHAHATPHAS